MAAFSLPPVEARADDHADAPATQPMDAVDLLTRAQWNAKPPAFEMTPHQVTAITIHHTATPQNFERDPGQTLRNLQAFSQREDVLGNGKRKPAWADVPYHFYIAPNGVIVEGRDLGFQGDTNTRYDLHGQAQVVLEGNFMEEQPTAEQFASLHKLVIALCRQHDVPADRIRTHRDRAEGQTSCPGDALQSEMEGLREAVGE